MLTIIGNLRINSLSKLEHMKSSFFAFNSTSDDWLLNIRGTFRDEAISFFREQLGEKVTIFNLLDDSRGWITNALEMLENAKYEYVLVWNEDHVNVAPQAYMKDVVSEMKKNDIEYLPYTWWLFGKTRKAFDDMAKEIDFKKGNTISYLDLTVEKWKKIRETGYPFFIISMCGIFKKEFLMRMWQNDQKRLPFGLKKFIFKVFGALTEVGFPKTGHKELFDKINRVVFRNKIRKYPKVTPFEMEKSGERYDMLPIRFAFPNQELFACIDDDLNTEGYSLVSRGVYKKVGTGFSTVERIEQILTEIKTVLTKVDQAQVDTLVRDILAARRIIASGAGRVGMAVRGFVMRLKHLGLDAYILGDANVPSLKEQDLFLVCSGSGETQTIFELTAIANRNQAKIALITGNPASRMGKLAQTIVEIRAPSKTKQVEGFASIQPMTTLNEQSIGIFFDAVVLRLMEELNETHETMWERHSNLE